MEFSTIADIIGVAGALFAAIAGWQAYKVRQERKQEQERQDKKVKVILKGPTHHIVLPFDLRRGETTRAEILGRIGMIPMQEAFKRQRFEIQYTNTESFLLEMYRIIDGKDDAEFIITCKPEELDQFDLTNFQHLIKPN
jgi:hypothetical protein